MTLLKALTLALLLSAAGAGAQAAPSLLGFSGTLLLPDTQVLPMGTIRGSSSLIWVDKEGTSKSNEWYSLSAGLLPRLEVGVSRTTYRTRPGDDTPLQAKFQVLDEGNSVVGLAFGAADVANDLSLGQSTAYVVASKLLWAPLDQFSGERIHPLRGVVGFGTGAYGGSPFAGLSWQAHRRVQLNVEYAKFAPLGVSNDHLFTLGAQVTFGNTVVVNAAAVDMRYPAISAGLQFGNLW